MKKLSIVLLCLSGMADASGRMVDTQMGDYHIKFFKPHIDAAGAPHVKKYWDKSTGRGLADADLRRRWNRWKRVKRDRHSSGWMLMRQAAQETESGKLCSRALYHVIHGRDLPLEDMVPHVQAETLLTMEAYLKEWREIATKK